MAGKGPSPNPNRRRRAAPVRGEWQATPGHGWQHGAIPDPPDGLRPGTVAVWGVWFRSWWASNWMPENLPAIGIIAQLYDQCQSFFEDPYVEKSTRKGDSIFVLKPNPVTELRQMMDIYGLSPKGQQDRRWTRPVEEPKPATPEKAAQPAGRYDHLRVVMNG